ncbi:MAG TPA: undecaprenyl/decaprenyl-phosphate alpha-N-acetylglucosaminyl 1-phosphate transferase [Micavibrio sp.]|nr:MraY family glycosyltransferase [Pseudomonadota bacterium]HIF26004.1 undecaprenyl/decaprenyl-phosphate alpha-N-acetylglucosaminyl 1-phosphate transferase [Micavibrio sp.]HIL29114.1 undecaprenyl/decaprenyl-phosphate alpha-N-acetylglucosaminyl 1-phosphate transferase [Micavibrio sp.]
MFLEGFLYFTAAFVSVLIFIVIGKKLAVRFGLVDHPGGRKKHHAPVPLIGGLTVFPAFMIWGAVYGVEWGSYLYFYAALVALMTIGALDDKYNLAPRIRFVTQFVVAFLIVVFGGAKLVSMGDMFGFGPFGLAYAAIPFSIIATVLLVNAINLIDGLDGLSGGKGVVCFFWLAVASVLAGNAYYLGMMAIMIGALAGFLLFNMRHPLREKASVFMGDAGSLALGLALAWFCITMARMDVGIVQPISVAWILAIPIWDICGQFARRVSEGRHPFDADLNHFHHHFVDAGMSVRKATYLILTMSFLTGAFGVLGLYLGLPEYVLTYLWIGGLFTHMYLSIKPARFKSLIGKLHK